MKTTPAYRQATRLIKTQCRFCGEKRDGKRGQMCAECRREYWREAQARSRKKKEWAQ